MQKLNDRITKLENDNREIWELLHETQEDVARLKQEIRKRGEG